MVRLSLFIIALSSLAVVPGFADKTDPPAKSSIYDINFTTIDGEKASLAEYKGKPVLIVNVASKCGYTGHYAGLQQLHSRYAEQGLVVLGVPSNDFEEREPGTDAEIKEFCTTTYGVEFPMSAKVSVTGEGIHPLYTWLSSETSNPKFFGEVKWNFEKILVGRDGQVANRFRTRVRPTSDEVVAAIEWSLLDEAQRAEAYDKEGPPALLEYRGREIARTMHWQGAPWLMRKVREEEERTSAMVKELRIKPGMDIADIGCGNGYHTLMMAELASVRFLPIPFGRLPIPTGAEIYGVDIQPEMLEMLGKRAETAGLKNITLVENRYWDADLPADSIDMALLADVYHEFSHPEEMLASLRTALRPGGQAVLLEFRTEDPKVPIKPEHKMSKAQVIKEMTGNGFKLVREYDELPWQHLMFFTETETETPSSITKPEPKK